jgi:hypothetical protein
MQQPDISKIERGAIQQTTGIARLAAALHVPAGWLERGDGAEPNWDGVAEEASPYLSRGRVPLDQAVNLTPLKLPSLVSWE